MNIYRQLATLWKVPFAVFMVFSMTFGTVLAQESEVVGTNQEQQTQETTAPGEAEISTPEGENGAAPTGNGADDVPPPADDGGEVPPVDEGDTNGEGDTGDGVVPPADDEGVTPGEGETGDENADDASTPDTDENEAVDGEGDESGTDQGENVEGTEGEGEIADPNADAEGVATPDAGISTSSMEIQQEVGTSEVTIYVASTNQADRDQLPVGASWTMSQGDVVVATDIFADENRQLPASILVEAPLPYGEYTVTIDATQQSPAFHLHVSDVVVDEPVERFEISLTPDSGQWPPKSTNDQNRLIHEPHVAVVDTGVCGEVTLAFINPEVGHPYTAWFEISVDGGGASTTPHFVIPNDFMHSNVSVAFGQTETRVYTGEEVRVRSAYGPIETMWFDWTSFTSEPCPSGTANITVDKNHHDNEATLAEGSTWSIVDRDTTEEVRTGDVSGELPTEFSVADLPYGNYTLSVDAAGHEFRSGASVDFTVDSEAVPVELTLTLTTQGRYWPPHGDNEANAGSGQAHVAQVPSETCGTVTLQFNNPTEFIAHFEVLVDGQPLTIDVDGNEIVDYPFGDHIFVPDGTKYPGYNIVRDDHDTSGFANPWAHSGHTVTYSGDNVEVRFALGTPNSAFFDWTSFTSEPCPEPIETVTPEPTETVTPEPTEPVTPEPTETVTPEPTEPVAPGEQSLVIRIDLPGDVNIEGAPYSLYAPLAAQQYMAEPFVQGFVGPNNTIQIDGLVPGDYRLVVEPEGMAPIDILVVVGTDSVTEAVIMVDENGEATVVYAGQEPPATDPATETPATETPVTEAPVATNPVTGLPETGQGSVSPAGFMLMAASMSVLLMGAGAFAIRRSRA